MSSGPAVDNIGFVLFSIVCYVLSFYRSFRMTISKAASDCIPFVCFVPCGLYLCPWFLFLAILVFGMARLEKSKANKTKSSPRRNPDGIGRYQKVTKPTKY